MIIEKNTHIICCLRNNAVLEGIVEAWSDNEAVLLSLSGENRLIICRPQDDIVFVKVVLDSLNNKKIPEIKKEISEVLTKTLQEPDVDLKSKSVKHLKALVNEQERKIIKEKTKNHQLGQPRIVEYHYPGTSIKQSGK